MAWIDVAQFLPRFAGQGFEERERKEWRAAFQAAGQFYRRKEFSTKLGVATLQHRANPCRIRASFQRKAESHEIDDEADGQKAKEPPAQPT